jgi:hypothetical protein
MDSYSPWRVGGQDSACNELCDSDRGHQVATRGVVVGALGSAGEDHEFWGAGAHPWQVQLHNVPKCEEQRHYIQVGEVAL